ncbi:MAG: phosphoribosylglycinamide formyltransferase [Clostridiales bacterium]|nr:MAG: phosphoribosylglycinamide formyltransferase [Clostridiales bacterium]
MKEEFRTKIAVFVSGGGTNLQALIDAEKSGIIKHGTLSLVVSSVDSAYALQRSRKAEIESVVSFDEKEILQILEKKEIELIVLAGYLHILSPKFVERYRNRIINVHPSLIPSFCGRGMYGIKVHEAALSYGVKLSGATVHYVNEIPDGGEIISQKTVCVLDDDTPESLQRRIMEEAEWLLLPEATEKISKEIYDEKHI